MILEVKDLHKSFNEKQVLKGINFSVSSGSALGLLGRNGAGKTTTIRIIMQLFGSNSGEVLLDGKPIDLNKVSVGYMPEERGLYPKKKVIEQLIYFGQLKGSSKKEAKESAKKLLARLEMEEYENAKLSTLSKGNQQKIQLIATLVHNPDIVILDEPFSGLDPVNAILLKDVVRELISDGKIVIFSSHQMNYIEEFCNDIVILNDGKVAVSGNIKEIKHRFSGDKIKVDTADSDRAFKFLSDSPLIKTANITNDGVITELAEGVTLKDITAVLSESEFDFDGVSVYEPSLNDIFVEYTDSHETKEEVSK